MEVKHFDRMVKFFNFKFFFFGSRNNFWRKTKNSFNFLKFLEAKVNNIEKLKASEIAIFGSEDFDLDSQLSVTIKPASCLFLAPIEAP